MTFIFMQALVNIKCFRILTPETPSAKIWGLNRERPAAAPRFFTFTPLVPQQTLCVWEKQKKIVVLHRIEFASAQITFLKCHWRLLHSVTVFKSPRTGNRVKALCLNTWLQVKARLYLELEIHNLQHGLNYSLKKKPKTKNQKTLHPSLICCFLSQNILLCVVLFLLLMLGHLGEL